MVIHAGDLVSLDLLKQLKSLCKDVKAVWGNMDPQEVRDELPQKEVFKAGNFTIGLYHGYGAPNNIFGVLNSEFKNDKLDVIVFGHTHRAGYAKRTFAPPGNPVRERSREKLFVNTGCWAKTADLRPVDTFVYINGTGLYLLEWKGSGKINCLFHEPHAWLRAMRP